MRQFVLPASWEGGPDCRVTGREARQLLRVLRLGPGDRFPALDTAGKRHSCEILSVDGASLLVAVSSSASSEEGGSLPDLRTRSPSASASPALAEKPLSRPKDQVPPKLPRIILAAAQLKGEKFDLVVRQATEAGVARIHPFTSSRSVGAERGGGRRERQERIIREALQQSGSSIVTRLEPGSRLESLPDSLGKPEGRRLSLLFHEAPLAEATLHRYLGDAVDEIVVCVGPEGGFSPEEVEFLRGEGFLPIRLPGSVLRAETAALFALAAVEIIYSERGSWIPETD
ncbi:MAG: RsmE family RNA methyltransferase [Spirochaetota bacterium]